MAGKKIEILIDQAAIARRIEEMAREIEKDFPDGEMVVVGVLKGAFVFMADLVRRIERPLACDFLRVSSYEQDQNTGVVRMEFDVTQPLAGKSILLVEDIVDSGRTLQHLIKHIEAKGPRMLKIASLLYKEAGGAARGLVDYVGFDVPDRYIVGYGLDSEGLYRSLPYVGAFRE